MSHLSSVAQSTETSARVATIPRETASVWDRVMRESANAATPQNTRLEYSATEKNQTDIESLMRELRREISAMMSEFRNLERAAGIAESSQQGQINTLMMMIASLGGSISAGQRDTPDYQRVNDRIGSLLVELAANRGDKDRQSWESGNELANLEARQSALQQALAQILQQLTSLHLRIGALKPLV
jgi:chromosome segregation ATPase